MKVLLSRRSFEKLGLTLAILATLDRSWAAGVEVNADASGLALHGYDPVAYFELGQPTSGDPALSARHGGATYLFASAAHRDAFAAAPDRYAPQYGGFCALGTAMGKKLDGDPTLWRIVDGRLYLNVNAQAQEVWLRDVPGNIAKADAIWPTIKDRPADAL